MRHFDKNGRPLLMKDGVQMEAKDGTKYLMKDDAIWKQLSTKGTLHPKNWGRLAAKRMGAAWAPIPITTLLQRESRKVTTLFPRLRLYSHET